MSAITHLFAGVPVSAATSRSSDSTSWALATIRLLRSIAVGASPPTASKSSLRSV
jgi:hypothetical protein